MKTVLSGMTTHVAKVATTLSNMWKVTRQDGVVHAFTDHDKDIVFAGVTYKSNSGFSRSAIASKTDLSVDNVDVTGIFNSDDITAQDIRSGKLDFADVELFLVNWQDPDTDGALKLRKGVLGETKIRDDGSYTAELRGLSQIFARRILEVYSPDCRADLFDTRCGLTSATFLENSKVESVADRQTFTLPAAFELDLLPSVTAIEQHAASVSASGSITNATSPAEDGSQNFPFLIADVTELEAFGATGDPDAHYALTADIDMTGRPRWTPKADFSGSIDGRGFVISNLDLDHSAAPRTAGLLGNLKIGGVVKRLGLVDVTIRSGSSVTYAGGLVADDGVSGGGGLIEDCYVLGGTLTTDGNQAGPLAGRLGPETILRRCWAATPISGVVGGAVGGLIGNISSSATQSDTFFDSEVATTTTQGGNSNATARTTAQMTTQTTFTNFDFSNTWRLPSVVADPSVTFADTNPDTIVRGAGSWLTDGFRAASRLRVSGTTSNNTAAGATLLTGAAPVALTLTLDASETLVAEGPITGVAIASYPRIMDPGRC